MGFPDYENVSNKPDEGAPPQSTADIVREIASMPAPLIRAGFPAPQHPRPARTEADEHAARTLGQLYRLADGHRLGKINLEEFGKAALRLLPPR